MKNVITVLKLFRLSHCIKNLFLFMPLFFAGHAFDFNSLIQVTNAFISFSLGAFAVYIFNDIQDIDEDRMHPVKKHRPIASGKIQFSLALSIMSLFFIISLSLMFILSKLAFVYLSIYIIMNIVYSLYLKKIAILDIIIIATGFVIRLFVGSSVSEVPLSLWIIILTFLLTLFIALAKRRDDLLIFKETGYVMRQSITFYKLKLLDKALVFLALIISIVYFSYSVSPEITSRLHTNYLYLSTLFVILGLLRYLYLSIVKNNSGSPVKIIFTDFMTQIIIVTWISFFSWIIYQ